MADRDQIKIPVLNESRDFLPQRLWDLFVNPSRLMGYVGRWPRWWPAGILILIINGVATTWVAPFSLPENHPTQSSAIELSLSGSENSQENQDLRRNPTGVNRVAAVFANGLNSWGATLLFSLILSISSRMAGGTGQLSQALGIVHWAALIPQGVGSLAKLGLALHADTLAGVSLSPAVFLSAEPSRTFTFVFLDSFFDVTVLWGLVVLVIGFGKVYQMDRASALLAVVLPWTLATGVLVGFRIMVGL